MSARCLAARRRCPAAAGLQRRLLPAAYTFEAVSFTLSDWLEPAETIGGDTFDYSLGLDQLHLSVTDTVGHGVDSALIATLCVGSLRNTRRHGASLLEQAGTTNEAMHENGRRGGLARLRLGVDVGTRGLHLLLPLWC